MSTALIQADTVKWARQRSLLTIDALAKKLSIKSEKLIQWEEGLSLPTFKQAQKLAKVLHIPFGYLFLQSPPVETLPIADLRTVSNIWTGTFSVDLRDIIFDVLRKQDWYREYRIEQGYETVPYIGKFSLSSSISEIVTDISAQLRLSPKEREQAKTGEQFLTLLVERCEELGIWVMRSGKVGNNTHRVLDVDEFRGFALCDEYAPAVFINGSDAKAAQIFTLIHELAHLWLGVSGVSDLGVFKEDNHNHKEIEILCNEVAAEVLVPKIILKKRWNERISLSENVDLLAKFFKVSGIVIARRALDIALISRSDFFSYYHQQTDSWLQVKESRFSGGDFYRNMPIANGKQFTQAVLQSVYSQKTLMRDGARLLGTNTEIIEKLAERIGIL